MPNKNGRPTVKRDVQMKTLVEQARGTSQIEIPISNGKSLVVKDQRVDLITEGGRKYVITSKTNARVRVTLVHHPKTSTWELTRHDGVPFSQSLASV
jgi:hypothetical protein